MNGTATRAFFAFACLLLAIATALAAVGSHALDGRLDADALHAFETAVHFQFFHALGLLAIAVYTQRVHSRLWLLAAVLLAVGIVLFCGGVYASSLDGPRLIARLAPTGGVTLIVGWLVAAAAALWPTGTAPARR